MYQMKPAGWVNNNYLVLLPELWADQTRWKEMVTSQPANQQQPSYLALLLELQTDQTRWK